MGKDNGAISKSGVKEAELCLEYGLLLKETLKNAGIIVYMTRETENALIPNDTENFKIKDMEKRKEFIEKKNPQFMISLHMNNFKDEKAKGAQVFYQNGNENGKQLAKTLQDNLMKNVKYAKSFSLPADLYILKTKTPYSVLVECGYLSNEEELSLLQTKSHQLSICNAILTSILTHKS